MEMGFWEGEMRGGNEACDSLIWVGYGKTVRPLFLNMAGAGSLSVIVTGGCP